MKMAKQTAMKMKKTRRRTQATRKQTPSVSLRERFALQGEGVRRLTVRLLPLIVVVVGIALVYGGYRWINNPQNLTIRSVEVVGNLEALDQQVLQPVIQPFAKTNLYLLDAAGLEQAIESNPWVYSASLTKIWPDKLVVKIHEQQPVAFWGKQAMLSQQGQIIKAVLPRHRGVLPLLYSPEKKGRNMASEFLQIREWMKDFPLKMVEFREDARGSWKIRMENGLEVKIGRNEHQKRIRRFMVGYRVKLKAVIDKIQTVDLRYTNGFAVKWKKGLSADSLFKG